MITDFWSAIMKRKEYLKFVFIIILKIIESLLLVISLCSGFIYFVSFIPAFFIIIAHTFLTVIAEYCNLIKEYSAIRDPFFLPIIISYLKLSCIGIFSYAVSKMLNHIYTNLINL